MQNEIIKLAINLNFWSALCGLIGAVLIFSFGLPPRVNPEGNSCLLLEQTDETEIIKAKKYKKISYFGASLLVASFLIQVILSIK